MVLKYCRSDNLLLPANNTLAWRRSWVARKSLKKYTLKTLNDLDSLEWVMATILALRGMLVVGGHV